MFLRSVLLVGAGCFAFLRATDGAACSCVGPHDFFVGPSGVEAAPLNTRVRFEVPAVGSNGPHTANGVLRVSGGAKVDASMRTWTDGWMAFVELTPHKPLAPSTRYEVAIIDRAEFPSTNVIGTFETGAVLDTAAPKLEAIGTAAARFNAHAGGGDCSIQGPWIDVGPVRAIDPGRPNAVLMYAIWADASGNVDTSKPPAGLLQPYRDAITIGKRSLCDPHDFTLPKGPFVSLAVAAVDEAGNLSAIRRFRVDMRGVVQP